MRPYFILACVLLALTGAGAAPGAAPVPRAVTADPQPDHRYPARMAVIHVPSGGVEINGVVYVASGPGPHPAFVLFHGLPGNEKNLDLAQAVRRAGYTVVTVNYRGSWGSPGEYRFAHDLEDARATLAYIRDPKHARDLSLDPSRIAIGGHSLGGWVVAHTLAADPELLGGVMISAADLGATGLRAAEHRAEVVAVMDDNRETLAGVTPESMTDELAANAGGWTYAAAAPALVPRHLLLLTSDDGGAPAAEALARAIRAGGGHHVATRHVATDHGWSDHRIALQALVIRWLATLPATP